MTLRPMIVEERNRPTIIGIVSRPDSVGDLPRASWKYWLRKTVRAEHRDADDAMPRSTASVDRAVAEEPQRDDRLAGPGLDDEEQRDEDDGAAAASSAVCQETQSNWWPASETQISSSETAAAMKARRGSRS